MKNLVILVSILIMFSCREDDSSGNLDPQIISTLVQPDQTDAAYSSSEKDHYVVRNSETHVNKLLLFLGGSFSTPQNYNRVCDHGANIGIDVISLSYPNNVAAAPLGTSSDQLIFDNYRDELCFGNAVSLVVDVDNLNSINMRTIKLLQYLESTFSDQNWGQYLTASNTLQWNKIIVSGHSQGSGHAAYLAKKNEVDRVAMFSGPNDYSTFFSSPANWLTQNGETPLDKHYALLHTEDQIVPFNQQVENLRALGLLSVGEDPVLADNLSAPYANANSLSLNIAALSNHNSTIGSNKIMPDIWTYMFIE